MPADGDGEYSLVLAAVVLRIESRAALNVLQDHKELEIDRPSRLPGDRHRERRLRLAFSEVHDALGLLEVVAGHGSDSLGPVKAGNRRQGR